MVHFAHRRRHALRDASLTRSVRGTVSKVYHCRVACAAQVSKEEEGATGLQIEIGAVGPAVGHSVLQGSLGGIGVIQRHQASLVDLADIAVEIGRLQLP